MAQPEYEFSEQGTDYPYMIMRSPAGKRFVITVDENGNLKATENGITRKHTLIKSGSYTGDGTISQAITGIGFKPAFIQVFKKETTPDSAVSIFTTTPEIIDDHVDGGTISAVSTFIINAIISIDDDGFTVDDGGNDLPPNKLNEEYNYIVFG